MFCPNCGSQIPDGSAFCGECGAAVVQSKPEVNETPVRHEAPQPTPAPVYQPQPVQPIVIQNREITQDQLPERFRPLSAWAYVGYTLLFSIPIVGFIFLIIFSCSGANVNRRSFARSYWCYLILALIIAGTLLIIAAASGGVAYWFRRVF